MHLKLEKTFPIDVSVDDAWRLLQNIKCVAECMPGAQITDQLDNTHYKGQVKVRVGPVSAVFKGDLEIKELDANEKKIEMIGKGSDTSGTSVADMDLTAWIGERGEGKCELFAVSDVHISGKMASFGGRMMLPVSDQIINQFCTNFAEHVLALAVDDRPAVSKMARKPSELNGLLLIWNVLLSSFKRLFSKFKSRSDN